MRTVLINGVVHAAPFADLFAPLTADELDALAESGRKLGFFHPVLTYESPAHGRAVLDGLNRAELALEHNISLTVQHLDTVPDESAEFICRRVNADRRHLTPTQQRRAREGRVKRVAEKRAGGKSLRAIADEEGVSEKTVRDDLKDSGAEGSAPDEVTGKDGKSYPSKKPPSLGVAAGEGAGEERPPSPEPDPPDEPEAFWKPKDSFADEVRSALRKLKAVKDAASMVFESPHAEHAVTAGKAHRLRWSWDGEDTVSERLGVQVVRRTWTCDEYDRLYHFLCDLEAWLRKDTPTPPEAQPWE